MKHFKELIELIIKRVLPPAAGGGGGLTILVWMPVRLDSTPWIYFTTSISSVVGILFGYYLKHKFKDMPIGYIIVTMTLLALISVGSIFSYSRMIDTPLGVGNFLGIGYETWEFFVSATAGLTAAAALEIFFSETVIGGLILKLWDNNQKDDTESDA